MVSNCQRLGGNLREVFQTIGISIKLYLTWIGDKKFKSQLQLKQLLIPFKIKWNMNDWSRIVVKEKGRREKEKKDGVGGERLRKK